MANKDPKNVKRFIENISKKVYEKAYEGGGTEGGTVVVNELPETGKEHTIYELHQTTAADFPWLLTEIDSEMAYPTWRAPTIVVGNEEDVNPDNLGMGVMPHGEQYAVGVYVTSTNKLYICWKEASESGPDVFNKVEIVPVNNLYVVGNRQLAILMDFDYHCTYHEGEEGSVILDGTGHFLDGTTFNYNQYTNVVPLVLTNATSKKIILDSTSLIGRYDVTDEEITTIFTQVNKIDLNLIVNEGTYVFVPQPSKIVTSYYIYTNDEWMNIDNIPDPNMIKIGITCTNGDWNVTTLPLDTITVTYDDVEYKVTKYAETRVGTEQGENVTYYGYIEVLMPTQDDLKHTISVSTSERNRNNWFFDVLGNTGNRLNQDSATIDGISLINIYYQQVS